MRSVIINVFIAFVVVFLMGTGDASGQLVQLRTVNTTSNTVVPNACITAGAPGCSLRGALLSTTGSGVLIVFAIPPSDPGCTAGVCTINLGGPLPTIEGSNLSITGPGSTKLILQRSGTDLFRPFFINSSGVVNISGMTIRNGNPKEDGGGAILKVNTGTLNLTDVNLSDSHSGFYTGGGIAIIQGTVNLVRSVISGNNGNNGLGGGIMVAPLGTCNVANSTIALNLADGTGGGIANAGQLNITNSTVIGNAAGSGGGIATIMSGQTTIKSTIVAQNATFDPATTGQDVIGSFVSAGFNLIGTRDGSTGFTAPTDLTGTNRSPLNPRTGIQVNGQATLLYPLRSDSPALDKGTSAGLTGPLTSDQRSGYARTRDLPRIPNAVGGDGTDIGAYESPLVPFDFDNDLSTDIGIFRPADGSWWVNRSSNGQTMAFAFGTSSDVIAPGDYTGDGEADIAFWRPATGDWYVLRSEDFSFFAFRFGTAGDRPGPGDFDGDGKADAAVFRPSTGQWFILNSTGPLSIVHFGANGDVPVASDYDGDGRTDVAVFRPSLGQWWLNRSSAGVVAFTFGTSTDKPVPGDYTGDNKADVAFWRPSNGNWFILRSENTTLFGFPFGVNGDVPAPGDYDGDGKFDATVFRPSNATWFSQRSNGGFAIQQFGLSGDRPIPGAFVP